MTNIWSFLLQTLSLAVTAALLLAVKALFRDKLPPRWQYGIWAILGLRAVIPVGLLGLWGPLDLRLPVERLRCAAEAGRNSALTDSWQALRVTAPIPRLSTAPRSLTDWLFVGYLAGVLLLLGWYLLSYLRLRRALRGGLPLSPARQEQLRRVGAAYGLPVCGAVGVPGLSTAFLCGVFRPVLALPAGQEVDDKVLLHELLHLRFHDTAAGVLLCLLRCLHWCNPLLWYCCDRIQNDCEALCDQRVLERLEGEERRAYGVILLSMANERYARAPVTSSMANGGKRIRARIQCIARFRRYPRGMGLGAACMAAVLATASLLPPPGLAAQALPVTAEPADLQAYALTAACTTPAGAVDTYAKALLADSALFRAAVTPSEQLPALMDRLERDGSLALSAPFAALEAGHTVPFVTHWGDLGLEEPVTVYQFAWQVYNLLSQTEDRYTGLLVFQAPGYETELPILRQEIAIFQEGERWVVEPLEELTPQDWTGGTIAHASPDLPFLRYTGQAGGYTVTLDYQYLLSTGSSLSAYGHQTESELTFLPDARFTDYFRSEGGSLRLTATGEARPGTLRYAPVPQTEGSPDCSALLGGDSARRISLPRQAGQGGGGGADPSGGAQWQHAPAAFAAEITTAGETCTLILTPEGGDPSGTLP